GQVVFYFEPRHVASFRVKQLNEPRDCLGVQLAPQRRCDSFGVVCSDGYGARPESSLDHCGVRGEAAGEDVGVKLGRVLTETPKRLCLAISLWPIGYIVTNRRMPNRGL